jgi:hypothetical protein
MTSLKDHKIVSEEEWAEVLPAYNIEYEKYSLYNLFLFHGHMKRKNDHALIRSIAYRTLLFRQQEGEKHND